MHDWLKAVAERVPDNLALIAGERTWTYRQLDALVDDVCGRLVTLGVASGDKIAVALPNDADTVCLIHATARLGLTLVPLNLRLTVIEQDELIEHVGAKQVIRSADDWQVVEPIAFTSAPLDFTAVQSIVFTSGTTGKPKGAQITFGNLYASALASAERLGANRWMIAGSVRCRSITSAGCRSSFARRFTARRWCCPQATSTEAIMQALHDSQATLVSLVPTQLYRMLEAGWQAPKSLRLILLGGAAAAPELVQRCIERDLPIALTYGLTECASQVATAAPDQVRAKPGTVGKPLNGTTVRDRRCG